MKIRNVSWLVLIVVLVLVFAANAATHDERTGGSGMPAYMGRTFVLEKELDYSTSALASNDVVLLIDINSNQYLEGITYQVVTAATSNDVAFTFSVGDNTTATGLVVSIDGYAGGGQVWAPDPDGGAFYTTTNSINATVTYGLPATGLVLNIKALITDFNL